MINQQDIQQSIQQALTFLALKQHSSGKFQGYSESGSSDTIFFTALIGCALGDVSGSGDMRQKAAEYLLAQRSSSWTWNYWERGSSARPYPDDLDDTVCSLAAIFLFDSKQIDSDVQASLAMSLIGCETQPGGPYRTWINAPKAEVWQDVDVAVNANIGYLLALLGVRSQKLNDYISDCITRNQLQSPYYVGVIPTLYFLSRWYKGAQVDDLCRLIEKHLNGDVSSLHTSMLIAAACNLGRKDLVTKDLIVNLLAKQDQGAWPAENLYFEPPEKGQLRHAASSELTTAFVAEALQAWIGKQQAQDLATGSGGSSIMNDPASAISRAIGLDDKSSTIKQLNQANSAGWEAYTIYDDILDGDADVGNLAVANRALRQSIRGFSDVFTRHTAWQDYVYESFDTVDEANNWEVLNARDVEDLPDYGDLHILAERSWGCVIAPIGVLVAAGYDLGGKEILGLQRFMHHYLIAKQLCDDAHDWQQDLDHGIITAVVVMLLSEAGELAHNDRQVYFWTDVMPGVNTLIRQHLDASRRHLGLLECIVDATELEAWVDAVEQSCKIAEQSRRDAQKFIAAFSAAV